MIKALYGLRRSLRLWFLDISSKLEALGFVRTPEAQCLFTTSTLTVFFYVDDIVVLYHRSNKADFLEFQRRLLETYELRDIGELKFFLGIRVIRDRVEKRLWLCQDDYILKIVLTFNLQDSKCLTIPLVTDDLYPYKAQATL